MMYDRCPECGGTSFKAIYYERGGVRVSCRDCGYVFIARIPEERI